MNKIKEEQIKNPEILNNHRYKLNNEQTSYYDKRYDEYVSTNKVLCTKYSYLKVKKKIQFYR